MTLQLPFMFHRTEELEEFMICPCISSTLSVNTSILKSDFTWNNEDQGNYPNQLLSVLVFTDLIANLIEVDYTGLEMPIFM